VGNHSRGSFRFSECSVPLQFAPDGPLGNETYPVGVRPFGRTLAYVAATLVCFLAPGGDQRSAQRGSPTAEWTAALRRALSAVREGTRPGSEMSRHDLHVLRDLPMGVAWSGDLLEDLDALAAATAVAIPEAAKERDGPYALTRSGGPWESELQSLGEVVDVLDAGRYDYGLTLMEGSKRRLELQRRRADL
jgi:hypothetical protein